MQRLLAFQFGSTVRFHSWDRHITEPKGKPVAIRADWKVTGILDPLPLQIPRPEFEKEVYDTFGALIGCELP